MLMRRQSGLPLRTNTNAVTLEKRLMRRKNVNQYLKMG